MKIKDKLILKSKIERIAEFYGYRQFNKAIEELGELIAALGRRNFSPSAPSKAVLGNILEEMADVEIMLEQLKIIMNCHDDIVRIKIAKVNRTLRRIEKEMKSGKPYEIHNTRI